MNKGEKFMREVYYFQTYHQGENAHSSNALLLLKRLYFNRPKIFYEIISEWLGNNDQITPKFNTQEKGTNKEKGKQSVLDFTITQGSFKLYVEAKEKDKHFSEKQMIKHLENLKMEKSENKLMIVLSPLFSDLDKKLFEELKQTYQGINIKQLTYLDIYNKIREYLDENRDFEMCDILDEYKKYCNEENLIDDTDNIVMARPAGDTIEFNVKKNVYYDGIGKKYEGFRYIALYNNKELRYVGKIEKILKSDETILKDYIHNNILSDTDRNKLDEAKKNLLSTYNLTTPHIFYLIEKFVPIENFKRRRNAGPLLGKKKFYLSDYNLKPNCSAKEIASEWKDKEW